MAKGILICLETAAMMWPHVEVQLIVMTLILTWEKQQSHSLCVPGLWGRAAVENNDIQVKFTGYVSRTGGLCQIAQ